jgi:hypothetical protein
MEHALAADFSHVRVHDGAAPAALAHSMRAEAFTVRSDVFFNSGKLNPHSAEGRRLLAHELAHVRQQGGAPASSTVIRRSASTEEESGRPDPRPGFAPPVGFASKHPPKEKEQGRKRFESLWLAVVDAQDETEAAFKFSYFLEHVHEEDLASHGGEVVRWMISHGHTDEAVRVLLPIFRRQMRVNFAVPTTIEGLEHLDLVSALITSGEKAAIVGNHDAAHDILLTAALGLAMRVLITTGGGSDDSFSRIDFHRAATELVGMMRRIHSVYPRLARQHVGYRPEIAEEYIRRGLVLAADLEPIEGFDASRSEMVANPGFGRDPNAVPFSELFPRGQGRYDMYGFGPDPNEHEPVTPLSGPVEAERPNGLTSLVDVSRAMDAQEILLTDIMAIPAVRGALGGRAPDMTDREDRIAVWKAIGKSDQSDPLAAVIRYMRRSLQAFTKHAGWNISETGKSYLVRKLPTDLGGRELQDCGVYAVTVASEVAHALAALGKLQTVEFSIVLYPGHAALVIKDLGAQTFYAVNNADITGPEPLEGLNVARRMGQLYAAAAERRHVVAPTAFVSIPTTNAKDASDLDAELWRRYSLVGSQWGLNPDKPAKDGKVELPNNQKTFDTLMETYDEIATRVEVMVGRHRRDNPDLNDKVALAEIVATAAADVAAIMQAFSWYGSRARVEESSGFRRTARGRRAEALTDPRTQFVSASPAEESPFTAYAEVLDAYIRAVESKQLVPESLKLPSGATPFKLDDAKHIRLMLEDYVLRYEAKPSAGTNPVTAGP